MAGKDRRKELARAKFERQQERREAEARRARRVRVIGGSVAAAIVVIGGAGVAYAVTDHGSGKKGAAASASPAVATSPTTATSCSYAKTTEAGAPKNLGTPPAKPAYAGTVNATLKTNDGDIQLQLDAARAACTVNSFGFLAGKKYFDGTSCHRLTSGTGLNVLQCGDPTGTGSGGPGYKFADENLPKGTGAYPVGSLAMANSGADTNGSQFFIVYGDSSGLGPNYTIFGKVTKGLDVVQNVAKAGSTPSGDGKPNKKVTINEFAISKQ